MQRIHKGLSFLFVVASTLLFSAVAFAEEAAAEAATAGTGELKYLTAGLTIALAASCGAFAQARAASAALEGIARNPNASGRIFTPMILGLALIESLVIYALIISFQLVG